MFNVNKYGVVYQYVYFYCLMGGPAIIGGLIPPGPIIIGAIGPIGGLIPLKTIIISNNNSHLEINP